MLFRKILKYFVLNVLLLMPLVAESQTEASLFIDRAITLSAEDRLGNTIEIKGHTNLPPGIQLRLVLKGFCAAPVRDYDQILDIVYLPVNAQGRFNSRLLINQRYLFYQGLKFLPDYYEVKMAVTPEEINKFNLDEDEVAQLKSCYYLDLVNTHHLQQRLVRAKAIKKNIDYLWLIDKEFRQQINSFEEVKQGSSEIEKVILRAFGIQKTKEEIVKELTRNWFSWELQWRKKVGRIINEIEDAPVYCVSTTDHIIQLLDKLSTMAAFYRQALDPENKLKIDMVAMPISPDDWAKVSSDEIKQHCFELLEYELLYKGGSDVMHLVGHLVNNYLGQIREPENIDLKSWNNTISNSLEYLALLKDEFNQYANEGLFQSKGFIDETSYPESYAKLQEVIRAVPDLAEPLNQHMINPTNKTYRYETTKITGTISGKIEEFFDILH